MHGFIRQGTALTIKVGPMVDRTDGQTIEAGLTISQSDVRLYKNGGAGAQKTSVTAGTYNEHGIYNVPLDATDTNTVGVLSVLLNKTEALPRRQDYMVLPAQVYDSIVAGTDTLDVAVTSINTTSVDSILDAAVTEPVGRPSWGSATLRNLIGWLGALGLNKLTSSATTETLRNDGDSASIATAAHSDDGTTFTRNKWG